MEALTPEHRRTETRVVVKEMRVDITHNTARDESFFAGCHDSTGYLGRCFALIGAVRGCSDVSSDAAVSIVFIAISSTTRVMATDTQYASIWNGSGL
jgi:hypothetical protein